MCPVRLRHTMAISVTQANELPIEHVNFAKQLARTFWSSQRVYCCFKTKVRRNFVTLNFDGDNILNKGVVAILSYADQNEIQKPESQLELCNLMQSKNCDYGIVMGRTRPSYLNPVCSLAWFKSAANWISSPLTLYGSLTLVSPLCQHSYVNNSCRTILMHYIYFAANYSRA